jgi:hypothetical protein
MKYRSPRWSASQVLTSCEHWRRLLAVSIFKFEPELHNCSIFLVNQTLSSTSTTSIFTEANKSGPASVHFLPTQASDTSASTSQSSTSAVATSNSTVLDSQVGTRKRPMIVGSVVGSIVVVVSAVIVIWFILRRRRRQAESPSVATSTVYKRLEVTIPQDAGDPKPKLPTPLVFSPLEWDITNINCRRSTQAPSYVHSRISLPSYLLVSITV